MVGHLTSMEGHQTSKVDRLTSMVGHLTSMVDTLLSKVAAPPVYGDCAAAKASGQTTSGVYTLGSLPSGVQAYCDMDTDGGGWTVIQRRQDGSVPFNRTWEEYKQGFGDNNGEYWLGNENIHLLTQQKSYTLRIDMSDWEGESRFAVYSTFRVAGESDGYRLTIDGYSGDAGDTMTGSPSNNGQKFSTVDRDNDASSSDHCSQDWGGEGGWWFSVCGGSNLNGRYLGNCGNCQGAQGVVWYHWKGNWYSMKSVSMKIRP
ncbi:angiopoietin-2-like [Branchiostoma lanceolatum]|uniref:angiopoietin-2-like n=1 Tax=Branchiostoma lanceolatum TaxID=7740 RepID=UPI003455FFB4